MTGQQQTLETGAASAPIIKEQMAMETCPQYFFLFIHAKIPAQGMVPPTVDGPFHLNQPGQDNLP